MLGGTQEPEQAVEAHGDEVARHRDGELGFDDPLRETPSALSLNDRRGRPADGATSTHAGSVRVARGVPIARSRTVNRLRETGMRKQPRAATIRWTTTHRRWSKMCNERWMRRKRRGEERFDEELRHLLDEEPRRPAPREPVVEHERDEEPRDPERIRVEAGTRS